MSSEARPIKSGADKDESAVIKRLLAANRVAVVGASDDPARAGNYVPEYFLSAGKQMLPVNPNHQEVLGQRCYRSLAEVPQPIDLVNVFRRPAACADIVREAIAAGAKGVWLQSGITNDEARRLAEEAGLDFVQDRCIMVEHRRSQMTKA